MTPELEPILFVAMILALVAAYPGWLMYQKAFYTSHGWSRWLIALLCLLLPPLIAAGCFLVPFAVDSGKQLQPAEFLADYVIFAICPAGLIALAGWVWDFMADKERPRRALIAGSALFAVVLLPIAFYFLADQAIAHFEIVLEQPAAGE